MGNGSQPKAPSKPDLIHKKTPRLYPYSTKSGYRAKIAFKKIVTNAANNQKKERTFNKCGKYLTRQKKLNP